MKQAALLIVYVDNKFLMFKRTPNDSAFPGRWGFVGGGIEPGETPEQALVREVQEEAGVNISDFNKLSTYGMGETTLHVFYTDQFPANKIVLDTNEHTEYGFFTGDELLNMDSKQAIYSNKKLISDFLKKQNIKKKLTEELHRMREIMGLKEAETEQQPVEPNFNIMKQKQVTWGQAAQLLATVKQAQVKGAAANAGMALAKIGLSATGLGMLKDVAEFVNDASDLAGAAKALLNLGRNISTQELKNPKASQFKELTGPFWDALKLSPEISQILDDKIEADFINKVLVPQIANPKNADQPLPNMDELLGRWLNKYQNLKNKADIFFKGRRGELTEEELLNEYIRKSNGKWVVYSKKGKRLGTHETEKEAKAQLAAIEISKAKRG